MEISLYFGMSRKAAELLALALITGVTVYVVQDVINSCAKDDEPTPEMD